MLYQTPSTSPPTTNPGHLETITEEQREHYFKHGYLVLPGFLSEEWVNKLNEVTDHFIELSKNYTIKDVLPLGRHNRY